MQEGTPMNPNNQVQQTLKEQYIAKGCETK